MAIVISAIRNQVRTRLPIKTRAYLLESELDRFLFLSEIKILSLLPPESFFDIQVSEITTEASVADGYVGLPTAEIQYLIATSLADSPSGDFIRMRIIPTGLATEYSAVAANPVGWFEGGNFYYSPDTSGTLQRVKFEFVPTPTESSILLPERFSEEIVSYAFALAMSDSDVNVANAEKMEFYKAIELLRQVNFGINTLNRGR